MEDAAKFVILLSTAGNLEEATKIAGDLVMRHLVACVNIIPSVHSLYWWDNKVSHDAEVILLMKTERARVEDVENTIRSLHSYEVPELLAIPITSGLKEYLKWLDDSVT